MSKNIQIVYGQNQFELKAFKDKLSGDFSTKFGNLNIESIDGQDISASQFTQKISELPFLASEKLLFINNLADNKDLLEKLPELLVNVDDAITLVIDLTGIDKRTKAYKEINKSFSTIEFTPKSEIQLKQWTVDEAKKYSAHITPQAVNLLHQYLGNDQFALSNELQKLALYSPEINNQTVTKCTVARIENNVFGLLDNLFSGNYQFTLEIYNRLIFRGEAPQMILAMLIWQFHILLIKVHSHGKTNSEIAQMTKLSPYSLDKADKLLRQSSPKIIGDKFEELYLIDHLTKKSGLDLNILLQSFFVTL